MKVRVYLAPCGIGLGHIARVHPIGDELSRRGIETVYSTYLEGLEYAKRNLLPTYEALPINFKVTQDGTIDFKRTAATSGFSLGIRMFLRQLTREIQFLKQFKPDIVLSDSRASSLVAARLLRIPVILMLNQFRVEIIRRPTGRHLTTLDRLFFLIANLGWLFIRTAIQLVWGRSQMILIPDLPAPYTISGGNLTIPRRYNEKVRLIGPVVEQNRRTHKNLDAGQVLESKSGRPLLYAAVSGPKIEREILSDLLLESLQMMSSEYQIILSRGEPEGARTPRRVHGVTVFDWVTNQDDLIDACDLVIGRAGHGTIMKSLSHGKPMILVPIPDHTEQYGNARRAETLHVAQLINQNTLNHETLKSKIRMVLEDRNYAANSIAISKETTSTHAITAACDVIEELGRTS